jgi:hypothetical protein
VFRSIIILVFVKFGRHLVRRVDTKDSRCFPAQVGTGKFVENEVRQDHGVKQGRMSQQKVAKTRVHFVLAILVKGDIGTMLNEVTARAAQ